MKPMTVLAVASLACCGWNKQSRGGSGPLFSVAKWGAGPHQYPSAASKVCKAGVTVRKNKCMLEVNALIIFMIGSALDSRSSKESLFCQSQLNGCYSPRTQQ